tara:strand:+ start:1802 stop:2680 length:879 start_codon:yes stop_codon:yes gene_type:complete
MTNKTRLNNHLKKRQIKERTEVVQAELIELQTKSGNNLENYYMNVKNLDEDALTMFWKPKQAANNAADGHEMIQAAVDGYKDVLESLTKGYNAVQSANDTFTDSDWIEVQNKLDQIVAGIKTTSRFTEFNGQNLIDGEYKSSTKSSKATFLVGVKPTDVVIFEPANMSPGTLGEITLDSPLIAQDGITEVQEVFITHFTSRGHEGVVLPVVSTDVAQIALNTITSAIQFLKETLSSASLTQDDLSRIKGFMETKARKGESFLNKFKSDRALELANELEDLEGQLELLNTMGN